MRMSAVAMLAAVGLVLMCEPIVAARVPPPRPHATHHHRAQRTAPTHKQEPKPSPAPEEKVEQVEQVESIEAVEPVEAVAPDAAPGAAHVPPASAAVAPAEPVAAAVRIAGHLHAASVHLPIAYILLWAAIVVAGPTLRMMSLNALARPLVWVAAMSFAPAISTGLARLTELSTGGSYDDAPALKHRNLMFAALAATVVGIVLTEIHHRWPNRFGKILLQGVAIVAAGLVAYSAHLGGQLVYGDDFLPF